VIAAILENPDEHGGQVYPLFGAVEMNHYQIADAISEALGRPVRYEPADIPTWIEGIKAQGFPEFLGQHLGNVAVDYQNGIFAATTTWSNESGARSPRRCRNSSPIISPRSPADIKAKWHNRIRA